MSDYRSVGTSRHHVVPPGPSIALLAFLALALPCAAHPPTVLAQSAPTVSIEMQGAAVVAGDVFEAYLWIEDAADLAGFDASVTYDESYLSLQSVEVATAFLESGGRQVVALGPTLGPGRVDLGAVTIPVAGSAGADGAGDLAVFAFRALAAGSTEIRLGTVNLVDVEGTAWTVDGQDATVVIVAGGAPTPSATPSVPPQAFHVFLPWAARNR